LRAPAGHRRSGTTCTIGAVTNDAITPAGACTIDAGFLVIDAGFLMIADLAIAYAVVR